jgi:hypothetical protein
MTSASMNEHVCTLGADPTNGIHDIVENRHAKAHVHTNTYFKKEIFLCGSELVTQRVVRIVFWVPVPDFFTP